MKCVCPMGGDRTCPNDCPLAMWQNLSPKDRKAQRKPIAALLYKQGFTMGAIATQLSVSHPTIVRDLREFVHDEQIKPAKTASNPKGAGRPKGSTKSRIPHVAARHDKIVALHAAGLSAADIAKELGVVTRTVNKEIERENLTRDAQAQIDPATLSLTAQQKFDVALRQHKRRLDLEFETRCREECRRWLNDISLPQYAKEIGELERSIHGRKGVMDRLTYRKILACLHPDRVQDPSLKKRYEEAFRLFTELEKRVLNEKESPTQFRKVPRTYEELMAMRAKVQAERRAKSAARKSVQPR